MTSFRNSHRRLRLGLVDGVVLAALLAVGSLQGEERRQIAFPSGERIHGFAGRDACITVNHDQNRLTVWNLADGKQRLVVRGDFKSEGLQGEAFCATRAAFLVSDERVVVYSLEDGSRVVELAPEDEHILAVALTPDGRTLAYHYSDGVRPQFKLVALPQGEPISIVPGASRHADCQNARWGSCLMFSPDSRLLVTSAAEVVATTEARTGKALRLLKGHRNQVELAAFSADGKRLATASCEGRMIVWDVDSGESIAKFNPQALGAAGANGVVSLSNDGGRVLQSEWGTTRVWSVADRKLLKELLGRKGPSTVRFGLTPDGKRLVEYGPELLVWDLEKPTDKPLRSLGKGVWFRPAPSARWIGHRPPDDDDDAPQKLVPVDFSAPP